MSERNDVWAVSGSDLLGHSQIGSGGRQRAAATSGLLGVQMQ